MKIWKHKGEVRLFFQRKTCQVISFAAVWSCTTICRCSSRCAWIIQVKDSFCQMERYIVENRIIIWYDKIELFDMVYWLWRWEYAIRNRQVECWIRRGNFCRSILWRKYRHENTRFFALNVEKKFFGVHEAVLTRICFIIRLERCIRLNATSE